MIASSSWLHTLAAILPTPDWVHLLSARLGHTSGRALCIFGKFDCQHVTALGHCANGACEESHLVVGLVACGDVSCQLRRTISATARNAGYEQKVCPGV